MADSEKVKKGLEHCLSLDSPCGDCPYYSHEDIQELECERNLRHDAITLLKEQEAVKRTSRKGTNGFRIVWTCGACGSDLHPNDAKAKYCSNCGQAVKWE